MEQSVAHLVVVFCLLGIVALIVPCVLCRFNSCLNVERRNFSKELKKKKMSKVKNDREMAVKDQELLLKKTVKILMLLAVLMMIVAPVGSANFFVELRFATDSQSPQRKLIKKLFVVCVLLVCI